METRKLGNYIGTDNCSKHWEWLTGNYILYSRCSTLKIILEEAYRSQYINNIFNTKININCGEN